MGIDKNKNPEQVEIYMCSKHSFIWRIEYWSPMKIEKNFAIFKFKELVSNKSEK